MLGMTRILLWYPVQTEVTKIRNVLGREFPSIFVLEKVSLMIVALEIQLRKVMAILNLDIIGVSVESGTSIPSVKRYREQE